MGKRASVSVEPYIKLNITTEFYYMPFAAAPSKNKTKQEREDDISYVIRTILFYRLQYDFLFEIRSP